jgi:hypothetical protein
MRNFSDKILEKIKTFILFSIAFFWGGGNRAGYEVM